MEEFSKGDRIILTGEYAFGSNLKGTVGEVTIAPREKYLIHLDIGGSWWDTADNMVPDACPEHEEKIYHDSREEWLCPFCEDI